MAETTRGGRATNRRIAEGNEEYNNEFSRSNRCVGLYAQLTGKRRRAMEPESTAAARTGSVGAAAIAAENRYSRGSGEARSPRDHFAVRTVPSGIWIIVGSCSSIRMILARIRIRILRFWTEVPLRLNSQLRPGKLPSSGTVERMF